MDNNEYESKTSDVETKVEELREEILGLENLPPETQEVVIESYEILEEGHQTINKYIEGTKHTENIPKALSIIDNNIPTEEERVVEIPPEKQEYIEDTVRVVNLCNKVVNIGIYNIDVKNQVGIYEVLEGYASKYNLITSEYVRNQFKDIGIEETREYYAKTPQATLRRIRDMVQKREETPQLGNPTALRLLAKNILEDYTLGSKCAQNETYENTLKTLRTFCSETSITDENFLNTLDGKTKEINQLYQEILVDEKCRDVISKRTGVTFSSMNLLEPSYDSNHQEGPLLDTRRIFSSTIKDKINTASSTLKIEITNKDRTMGNRGLQFVTPMPELNKIKEKIIYAKKQYSKNLKTIENMLPPTEKPINTDLLTDPRESYHFETIVSKAEMEEIEQQLITALQSGKLLFHGTGQGGNDTQLKVLKHGAMSRSKQMEILGESRYNTVKDGPWQGEEGEKNKKEHRKTGADIIFLTHSFQEAYTKKSDKEHFVIGVPEGTAYRNYSISARIPSRIQIGSSGERELLDRDNPEGGCIIKPEDSYLFIGVDRFQRIKEEYEKTGGTEFEEMARSIWGDRLIVSDTIPPESIEGLNLPPVNHARVLPTKHLVPNEAGGLTRVYKIVYS